MYNKKQNDAIKEQSRLVDEISATTEKMQKVGEITGKVGASQLMQRKRESKTGDFTFTERDGISFGSTFFQSEIGKSDLASFQKRFELMPEEAMREFALKLGSYVSDGVIDSAQALNIARQIGIQLGDESIGLNVRGKLMNLITSDGKDISKEPFEIRIKIAQESVEQLKNIIDQSSIQSDINKINEELKSFTGRTDYARSQRGFFKNTPTDPKEISLIKRRDQLENILKYTSAASGAVAAQSLETIKAQVDAIEVNTQKEIDKLVEQKKNTQELQKQEEIQKRINDLENKRNTTINKLKTLNQDIFKNLEESFKYANQFNKKNELFVGLDETVLNKYKGGDQEAFANQFNQASKALGETSTRAKLQTLVGSGLIAPLQATGLIGLFGGEEKEIQKTIRIFTAGAGVENIGKIQSVVGNFEDKDLAKELTFKFGKLNSKDFDTAYNTIDLLQNLNMEEINLEQFLAVDDGKAFDKLAENLQKIEDLPDVNKKAVITVIEKNLTNIPTDERKGLVNTVKDNWEYFSKLPAEDRKTAIQTYLSIYSATFATPEARMLWARQIANEEASKQTNPRAKDIVFTTTYTNLIQAGGKLTEEGAKKSAQQALEDTQEIINAINNLLGSGDSKKKTEAGKTEPSFLDDFLKKLRDVRDNTIQITKGFDASMKALKKILSGDKDIKIFSGIEQDLNKLGLGDSFIDLMTGMDPKEFKDKKNSLFEFDNKGNITGLKEDAKVIKKALLEIALGDFQSKQLGLIKNTQNQTKAVQRLVASGMSATDAFKAVEDTAFAAAVASDELKDDESWYLTFYGRYHESKWIKVIPGYEREFLENFRDEVIPVLKNINTLDSLIGDYLTNSMNGNIEMKLKSIRRDNIIQKLQN
jgi:hypothetical protein